LGIEGKKRPRRSKPSAIKTKKKNLTKLTREIASLKTKVNALQEKRGTSSDDDAEEADEPQDNAGDQFGGRQSKKKKKN
jgi:hypothetical protein